MHVGTTQRVLTIEQHAKSGRNPGAADTVKLGFFTSGWFQKTMSTGMAKGYNKDDSSQTYVFTGQTVTFYFQ